MTAGLDIMVGVPGSGKSTQAHRLLMEGKVNCIVNPDTIREEIIREKYPQSYDPYFYPPAEDEVWKTTYQSLGLYLLTNYRVLLDATNLTVAGRRSIRAIADACGVETRRAWKMSHCASQTRMFQIACERNASRDRRVPDGAMARMYLHYTTEATDLILREEGWEVYNL